MLCKILSFVSCWVIVLVYDQNVVLKLLKNDILVWIYFQKNLDFFFIKIDKIIYRGNLQVFRDVYKLWGKF